MQHVDCTLGPLGLAMPIEHDPEGEPTKESTVWEGGYMHWLAIHDAWHFLALGCFR